MILSCGEALIDMLPRVTTGDEPAFAPYPGGAVFNTAIALGRLGAPSAFLSGLSTDLFGRMLTDALEASRVDTALAIRSDRPTTLAFVTLTNGQASYAFYDENTAGRMIAEADLPTLPETVEALFFGGLFLMLIGAIAVGIVQIYLMITRSQTIGKWLVGTQVRDYDTKRPASFVQYFVLRGMVHGAIGGIPCVGWIYQAVDMVFLFTDPEHRTLHDKIANTYVVDIS